MSSLLIPLWYKLTVMTRIFFRGCIPIPCLLLAAGLFFGLVGPAESRPLAPAHKSRSKVAAALLPIKLVQRHSLNGKQVLYLEPERLKVDLDTMRCHIYYDSRDRQVTVVNHDRRVFWQGAPSDFQLDSDLVCRFMFPPEREWRFKNTEIVAGIKGKRYESRIDKSLVTNRSGFVPTSLTRFTDRCRLIEADFRIKDGSIFLILARLNRVPNLGGVPLEAGSGSEDKQLSTESFTRDQVKVESFRSGGSLKRENHLPSVLYVDSGFIEDLMR